MKRWNVFLAGCVAMALVLSSCSDDDDKDPAELLITQAQLDESTNFIKSFTGGQMAHAGPLVDDADSTIREVFSSEISLDGGLSTGVIVTKNTYKKNPDGSKGDLLLSFAMIKREAGYDDENENWEYVMIPFDENVDYSDHPYGILPEVGSDMRGQLASCISCHAGGGGGDYLFVND